MATTKPKTSTKRTTSTAKKPTTRSTTAKTATKTPVAAAPQPAVAQAEAPTPPAVMPEVVDGPQPVVAGPMMRKKELVDKVVEASGIKKKDAKPVVEAMLRVLGDALRDGRELNLHPFGNMKVRRAKEMTKARVLTTKVRQRKPGTDLPEAAE